MDEIREHFFKLWKKMSKKEKENYKTPRIPKRIKLNNIANEDSSAPNTPNKNGYGFDGMPSPDVVQTGLDILQKSYPNRDRMVLHDALKSCDWNVSSTFEKLRNDMQNISGIPMTKNKYSNSPQIHKKVQNVEKNVGEVFAATGDVTSSKAEMPKIQTKDLSPSNGPNSNPNSKIESRKRVDVNFEDASTDLKRRKTENNTTSHEVDDTRGLQEVLDRNAWLEAENIRLNAENNRSKAENMRSKAENSRSKTQIQSLIALTVSKMVPKFEQDSQTDWDWVQSQLKE